MGPEKAYQAINESLKQSRNNWRVWTNKLYLCLDLQKFDEAIQAQFELITLQAKKKDMPPPEEKCVKAIVAGSFKTLEKANDANDKIMIDSAKRTLARVEQLLRKISSVVTEPWIWEISARFHNEMGQVQAVLEDLM